MTRRGSPGARLGRPAAALNWGEIKRRFWGIFIRQATPDGRVMLLVRLLVGFWMCDLGPGT
jgi:hypothetical protein